METLGITVPPLFSIYNWNGSNMLSEVLCFRQVFTWQDNPMIWKIQHKKRLPDRLTTQTDVIRQLEKSVDTALVAATYNFTDMHIWG